MVLISVSEKSYITLGIESNFRNDGRGRLDFRPATLETGLITQASGSARIRIAGTDVLVGIKAEIGQITVDSIEEEGSDEEDQEREREEIGYEPQNRKIEIGSKEDKGRVVCLVER